MYHLYREVLSIRACRVQWSNDSHEHGKLIASQRGIVDLDSIIFYTASSQQV